MDIVNSNSNDCSLIRIAALRQAGFHGLYIGKHWPRTRPGSEETKAEFFDGNAPIAKSPELFKSLLFMNYYLLQ